MATADLEVGTSVGLLAEYDPVVLAKVIATLYTSVSVSRADRLRHRLTLRGMVFSSRAIERVERPAAASNTI